VFFRDVNIQIHYPGVFTGDIDLTFPVCAADYSSLCYREATRKALSAVMISLATTPDVLRYESASNPLVKHNKSFLTEHWPQFFGNRTTSE
jgi:hypothetical protein